MYKFDITGSKSSTILNDDAIYIDVNERIQVVIEPDDQGNIQMRVYPITKDEYWCEPFAVFDIDINEIEALEKEMED